MPPIVLHAFSALLALSEDFNGNVCEGPHAGRLLLTDICRAHPPMSALGVVTVQAYAKSLVELRAGDAVECINQEDGRNAFSDRRRVQEDCQLVAHRLRCVDPDVQRSSGIDPVERQHPDRDIEFCG